MQYDEYSGYWLFDGRSNITHVISMKNICSYESPIRSDEKSALFFKVGISVKMLPQMALNHNGSMRHDCFFSYVSKDMVKKYQIHYITDGSGEYEDATGSHSIGPGTLIINKPGDWRRFTPSGETGWVENYLAFNWPLAERLVDQVLLSSQKSVYDVGIREDILETCHHIFESANKGEEGLQQYISGMLLKLFGVILTCREQDGGSEERLEGTIRKACFFIKRNISRNIDFKKIASENNLGYEHFRKVFKQVVGFPPGQYHLHLKIAMAKKMLGSTNKSVKEISYDLGFDSVYYFCRLFKKKTGVTPTQVRKQLS